MGPGYQTLTLADDSAVHPARIDVVTTISRFGGMISLVLLRSVVIREFARDIKKQMIRREAQRLHERTSREAVEDN